MRLKSVAIEGFRGAKNRIELNLDKDFTILTGRNDAGKSTFLEALDVFFKGAKINKDDFNMNACSSAETAYIEVTFDKLPDDVVLDAKYHTTFEAERLTNGDGGLTIRHTFTSSKIAKSLRAKHLVTKDGRKSLLAKSNKELKTFATENSVSLSDCNSSINAQIRETIYKETDLFEEIDQFELDDSMTDMKSFFAKIEKNYPVFHLFSAENVSDEGEKYVQDPVKVIVKRVIDKHKDDLDKIAQQIDLELTQALTEVSDELELLAPTLKTSFSPHNIDAKWESAYKSVAFHDENNVPLATRGSGMRRLALLSFFRVSAREDSKDRPVIFAVEEPEVFLHPDLQREVWDALTDLALQSDSQVLITSHSSNLIARTEVTQVRYLSEGSVDQVASLEDSTRVNEFVAKIEQSLGKFRDSAVELFLLVEGKNDITAIENLVKNSSNSELDAFGRHIRAGRVLLLPIGGTGSAALWGTGRLKGFSKPVVFLRDRDDKQSPNVSQADMVEKLKGQGYSQLLHSRREMENFLSIDLIESTLSSGWKIDVRPLREGLNVNGLTQDTLVDCDVPVVCAQAFYYAQQDGELTEVDLDSIKSKESVVKGMLARAFERLDNESVESILSSNFGSLIRAINETMQDHLDATGVEL